MDKKSECLVLFYHPGNDVVVTAVEPEPQINQTITQTGLMIGIGVGAVLLIINVLVCVSVHYQRRKLRKKYPKTAVRSPSSEKRNGASTGQFLVIQLQRNRHQNPICEKVILNAIKTN